MDIERVMLRIEALQIERRSQVTVLGMILEGPESLSLIANRGIQDEHGIFRYPTLKVSKDGLAEVYGDKIEEIDAELERLQSAIDAANALTKSLIGESKP